MFKSAVRTKRRCSFSAIIHFSQKHALAMEIFLAHYFFPKIILMNPVLKLHLYLFNVHIHNDQEMLKYAHARP